MATAMTKRDSYLTIALVVAMSAIILAIIFLRPADPLVLPDYNFASSQVAQCEKMVIEQLKLPAITIENLGAVARHCYSELYSLNSLNEFQIRRLKFIQQTYDERILLWMVVAITIGGVVLAGLQLFASFRLAASGEGTLASDAEFVLERNKLSLKSSVTGLFILAMSFAFFVVFVYEIYTIKEVNIEQQAASRPAAAVQPVQLGSGTIDPASKPARTPEKKGGP